MKRSIALAITLVMMLSLCSCSGTQPSAPAAADDLLVGDWIPAGVEINHTVYSFEVLPQIEGSYDGNHLTVSEDGTFVYTNFAIFITKGSWNTSWMEGYDHAYTLINETGYSLSFENGEMVRTEEGERDGQFKVWLTNEDPDTLVFSNPDSDQLVYYTRDSGNAFYLDVYSASLSGDTATAPQEEETPAPSPEPVEKPDPKPSTGTVTMGMRNALTAAHNYLDVMAFSYSGLIDQLEFEGYTYEEAVYGADNCGADWYEQAALMAVDYLDTMPFSRSDLIDQLEFEGFTYDQAVYGVEQAGY